MPIVSIFLSSRVELPLSLSLSLLRALSTHCSRQITHSTAVVSTRSRVTRATRWIYSHSALLGRARTCPLEDQRRRPCTVTRLSRSTRPNVAGADGGVNRWRREHRHWRPRQLRRPPTGGRIAGWARAHIDERTRARAMLLGDRNRNRNTRTSGTHTHTRSHAHAHRRAPKSRADTTATLRRIYNGYSHRRTTWPSDVSPPFQHHLTGVHRCTPTRSRPTPSFSPTSSSRSRGRSRYDARDSRDIRGGRGWQRGTPSGCRDIW